MPESPPFRLTNTLAREVQTVTPVAYDHRRLIVITKHTAIM